MTARFSRGALRSHLLTLVLLAIVPPLFFSVWLGVWLRNGHHAALEQAMREASRAIAVSVEREIGETTEGLEALATDASLDGNDLRPFYEHAAVTARVETRWKSIALFDAEGRALFHVARPLGTSLPSIGDRPYFRDVVRTRRPVVSDVIADRIVGESAVIVAIPVVRHGRLQYVLAASVNPLTWASVVASSQVRPEWIVSISDGERRYITRSRNGANIMGRMVPPDLATAFAALRSGFGRFVVLEGDEAYVGWEPVNGTRWTVALGTVTAPIDASGRRIALTTAGISAAVTVAAALLALLVARRIANAVRTLARSAAQVGRGEEPRESASGIAELDAVGTAIRVAGRQRANAEAALRAAEERARRNAAAAEEATRAKDRFLALISHELRTPLTSILAWTRMLARDVDPEVRVRAIETIDRNVRLQVKLVDDLLDVSRIVTGKLRLERRQVSLDAIVTGAVQTVRPVAAANGVTIVERVDASCGPVDGDPARLDQVVINLLNNAIKFTPASGRITVALSREGADAVLTVADTGQGIDADVLPYVFDAFRQADGSVERSSGGLGLGLAIVRHLVEAHEGTVAAASPGSGQGATFTVRLPICGPDVGAGEGARDDGRGASAS